MPLFITTLAAFTTLQVNTAVAAGVMAPGLTLIWTTGNGPDGAVEEAGGEVTVVDVDPLLTVTVADLVTDPEALTAVNV
jgi:lactate dehydrogenase-like 2-hydroxyacid dehydrogenase